MNPRPRIAPANLLLLIPLSLAVWFAYPRIFGPRTVDAVFALGVIRTGLDRYAVAHMGVYPREDMITGDPRTDVLLKRKFIHAYPRNPFAHGRGMRNSRSFSPGDFHYQRAEKLRYSFTLDGFGAAPTSGPRHDGIVASNGSENP